MDRLTMTINNHVYYTKGKYETTIPTECETADVRNILNRLAQYEDTGLMPDEITALKAENNAYTDCKNKLIKQSKRLIAENAQLRKERGEFQKLCFEITQKYETSVKINTVNTNILNKVTKERDAAVEDMNEIVDGYTCEMCDRRDDNKACKSARENKRYNGSSCFRWRGIQNEEGKV